MSLSLKLRQLLVSVFLLLFLLPSSFIAIDRAFYTQLLTSTEQKLEVHLYAILSELGVSEDKVELQNNALAPDFYRPDSGLSAYITHEQSTVWQSDSSLNQEFSPPIEALPPGEHLFQSVQQHGDTFWVLSISLLFDAEDYTRPLTVHVVQTNKRLIAPQLTFRTTLIQWFFGIGFVLLLLMVLAYYWTTKPLSQLDHEIRKVETGGQEKLIGKYPAELSMIKEDLNLLLANQNRQKQRYRHHLSDLAHALKTPVAVLQTSVLSQQPELKEQLDRITSMIEHQLKRAASSGQDVWKKQIAIKPLLDKLVSALTKIYRDKNIQIELNCPENSVFRGDETDLMEILGNLLDNACKACRHQVSVTINQLPDLVLCIEDDGPGVPVDKRQQLFVRGTRLDTYHEGHGVGLAIVAELVSSYSGNIALDDSELGGARFSLRFS
ncbi:ATP-binding protein [Rheinheimera baltica]|uniref:histidine kinase n=2 Tax=Rheinheimera baltica TaxID=67576 RepID=A0ABT9HU77_9GAMM|nr:ATP-binding protein [Rheinheimera baltica]MDP5134674.1 ATP-binding protein [Rheinheimera baltica]MDP5141571.1 ATP-binding protein [Rheinheimera baltica]MDP5148807.1 ATP-binding protein [Rheinheimera baltica]